MRDTLEDIRGGVGIWTISHEALPPERSGEYATLAEELGYKAYWLPETAGRDALVSSALLLEATTSIVIGTSIASIWARDAVTAVNGARTLTALSSGRFVLGLGVSHQIMVENIRGHSYERPLAAMSSYLDAMAAAPMFSHERDVSPVVLIAALGPKMLALASTKAAGALPYFVTPEHTARARAALGPDAFLAVEQGVALTEDEDTYRALAARHAGPYLSLPNYQNNWRRLGFGDEDFLDGGSARFQDALIAHGDESAVWARVDEHFAAGADHVSLQVLTDSPVAAPLEEWRRLSPLAAGR
jgi:probable F420-dependent oxidoreductase